MIVTEKTRLISLVLGETMGHANPSVILEHLLQRTNSVATFGEIRHLLTGLYSFYTPRPNG